jgi:hypothetical protein
VLPNLVTVNRLVRETHCKRADGLHLPPATAASALGVPGSESLVCCSVSKSGKTVNARSGVCRRHCTAALMKHVLPAVYRQGTSVFACSADPGTERHDSTVQPLAEQPMADKTSGQDTDSRCHAVLSNFILPRFLRPTRATGSAEPSSSVSGLRTLSAAPSPATLGPTPKQPASRRSQMTLVLVLGQCATMCHERHSASRATVVCFHRAALEGRAALTTHEGAGCCSPRAPLATRFAGSGVLGRCGPSAADTCTTCEARSECGCLLQCTVVTCACIQQVATTCSRPPKPQDTLMHIRRQTADISRMSITHIQLISQRCSPALHLQRVEHD